MVIRLIDLQRKSYSASTDVTEMSGWVEIELAGKKKKSNLNYTLKYINNSTAVLTGRKKLTFSEFGLKPPTKFNGNVMVRDQIDVAFTLQLQRI